MSTGEKDEDLVMVGDGVEDADQELQPGMQADDDKDEDDDGEGEGEDDGELAAGDERAGAEEPGDDDRKERRRVENKSRRTRQKEARERDQRELKFLRSRNEQVEKQIGDLARRQNVSEQRTVDQRINQLDNAIRSADDVYAKAIDAGEGKDASEAMRIRDQLKDQRTGLQAYKEQGLQQPVEEQGPDPELVEQVRTWHDKNQWFDFGRRDEDSAIVGAIDDMLVRDGWDPRTPEYYEELDKRVARRLPHISKRRSGNGAGSDDYDDDRGGDAGGDRRPGRRPGGPKFRVGGRERSLKSNEVHISRERREAMEEAGVWEDPVLRKNYLKRYADWDREHANDNA